MAEVDFSNARIEPVAFPGIGQGAWAGYSAINPTGKEYVSLSQSGNLYDANGANITSSTSSTKMVSEKKQLMYLYQGTFNASGTECYKIFYGNNKMGAYKISNISFQSGDTYVFMINADLVCN